MQTALDMNDHYVGGVLVNENDQKSAVSVGYLEEGFLNVRDKSFHDFFVSFIDFRTPDTYDLSQEESKNKKMKKNSLSEDMVVKKVWTSHVFDL